MRTRDGRATVIGAATPGSARRRCGAGAITGPTPSKSCKRRNHSGLVPSPADQAISVGGTMRDLCLAYYPKGAPGLDLVAAAAAMMPTSRRSGLPPPLQRWPHRPRRSPRPKRPLLSANNAERRASVPLLLPDRFGLASKWIEPVDLVLTVERSSFSGDARDRCLSDDTARSRSRWRPHQFQDLIGVGAWSPACLWWWRSAWRGSLRRG